MLIRLQKYMADCGVASRRASEQLIKEGLVTVDGRVVTEMGVKIDKEKNTVMYNGRVIKPEGTLVYIALNKPEGYITSSKDQFGRLTVLDLLKDVNERVFPVGRLDYDSSGLIFLTNDGEFAYKMTHPQHNIYKRYLVTVKGILSESELDALKNGIPLDGVLTAPAIVSALMSDKETKVNISIREGKNRQVRRMMEYIGHPVISLHRTAIGSVLLGDLEAGCYRRLKSDEIRSLI